MIGWPAAAVGTAEYTPVTPYVAGTAVILKLTADDVVALTVVIV